METKTSYQRTLNIDERIYLKAYLFNRFKKIVLIPTYAKVTVCHYGKFIDWAIVNIGSGSIQLNDQRFKD